jgi:hypothetical protein
MTRMTRITANLNTYADSSQKRLSIFCVISLIPLTDPLKKITSNASRTGIGFA